MSGEGIFRGTRLIPYRDEVATKFKAGSAFFARELSPYALYVIGNRQKQRVALAVDLLQLHFDTPHRMILCV